MTFRLLHFVLVNGGMYINLKKVLKFSYGVRTEGEREGETERERGGGRGRGID